MTSEQKELVMQEANKFLSKDTKIEFSEESISWIGKIKVLFGANVADFVGGRYYADDDRIVIYPKNISIKCWVSNINRIYYTLWTIFHELYHKRQIVHHHRYIVESGLPLEEKRANIFAHKMMNRVVKSWKMKS